MLTLVPDAWLVKRGRNSQRNLDRQIYPHQEYREEIYCKDGTAKPNICCEYLNVAMYYPTCNEYPRQDYLQTI
jgi:hypothetical protein